MKLIAVVSIWSDVWQVGCWSTTHRLFRSPCIRICRIHTSLIWQYMRWCCALRIFHHNYDSIVCVVPNNLYSTRRAMSCALSVGVYFYFVFFGFSFSHIPTTHSFSPALSHLSCSRSRSPTNFYYIINVESFAPALGECLIWLFSTVVLCRRVRFFCEYIYRNVFSFPNSLHTNSRINQD